MPLCDKRKSSVELEVFEDGTLRLHHHDPMRTVVIKPDDDCRDEIHRFLFWGPTDAS